MFVPAKVLAAEARGAASAEEAMVRSEAVRSTVSCSVATNKANFLRSRVRMLTGQGQGQAQAVAAGGLSVGGRLQPCQLGSRGALLCSKL